jgi:hypothetical protein
MQKWIDPLWFSLLGSAITLATGVASSRVRQRRD